jgi:hypothetical protein
MAALAYCQELGLIFPVPLILLSDELCVVGRKGEAYKPNMAQDMQRDSAGTHTTDNVQVRIMPIHRDEDRTVIQAAEVICHGDTGEIETTGDVRITIELTRQENNGCGRLKNQDVGPGTLGLAPHFTAMTM